MPNIDLVEARASGVLTTTTAAADPTTAGSPNLAATLRPVDGAAAIAAVLSTLLASEPVVELDVTVASVADEAPAVLAALTERPRLGLRRLVLQEKDFDPEDSGEIEEPAVTAAELGDLTAALPALTDLTLLLSCLSDGLRHRTLRTLDMVAVALGIDPWTELDLPSLARLRFWLPGDVYGVAVEGEFLDPFWTTAPFPALRELDLADLETDGTVWTDAMRDSALLPRLDVLRLKGLYKDDEEFLAAAPLTGLSRFDVRWTDTPEVEAAARQLLPTLNVIGD
jgi:hypothetical protein